MLKNKDTTIEKYKLAMANYPTGVTVVTTSNHEGLPAGLTVNSFASVSLDPLLVLWSIDNTVSTYPAFKNTDRFAVNILSETQKDTALLFASKEEDRFAHCEWEMSEHDLPVLANVASTLQCKVHKRVEAGDHIIFIGEVMDMHVNQVNPLLYHNRHIGAFPKEFDETDK